MIEFPTLETERLRMRTWREEDLDDYCEITSDPETVKFLSGTPMTRGETWRHMAMFLGHFQLRGFSHWAVEEKASGKMIGRIGFLQPAEWPDFEIGWTINRSCWGKGYASEGARAALVHAVEVLGRTHVISLIHPDNAASIRVAERLGETLETRATVMGKELLVYGMQIGA